MVDLIILRSPVGDLPSITLPKDRDFTLGRGRASDWFLEADGQISTLHLTIRAKEDHVEFRDSGSTNGTFLNEKRVSRGTARDGDQLRIGQTVFAIKVRQILSDEKPLTTEQEWTSPSKSSEYQKLFATSDSQIVEKKDPYSSSKRPFENTKPIDMLWLEPSDSRHFPICIIRGSTYYIGKDCTQSANETSSTKSDEAENDTPILKLKWLGDFCEVWAVNAKSMILLNGLVLTHDVLHTSDRLQIEQVHFEVHYQTTEKPTKTENHLAEPFEGFETAVGPIPNIKRRAITLPDTEVTQPQKVAAPQNLVAPLGITHTKNDEHPLTKVPSEAAEKVTEITASNCVPAALAGNLPDVDPISGLLSLAENASLWLMEIDVNNMERFSLPFKVSKEDAAWMLNVQASWPKSNYLVAFGGESADRVFEEIANLQAKQTHRQLTYDHLSLWALAEKDRSKKSLDLLLIEGPTATWVYLGSTEVNPVVMKTLLEWAKG